MTEPTLPMVPHLQQPGEEVPNGAKTYSCPVHGQTIGAWYCASPEHCRFGDATAAQIGAQELSR